VPARVQAVEIGPAVNAEQHGLAVEDERAAPVAERGLGDQRESIGAVAPVARSKSSLEYLHATCPIAVIVPTSSEQVGVRLVTLTKVPLSWARASRARSRTSDGAIFGHRCTLPKQKQRIDLLDVDATILLCLLGGRR